MSPLMHSLKLFQERRCTVCQSVSVSSWEVIVYVWHQSEQSLVTTTQDAPDMDKSYLK